MAITEPASCSSASVQEDQRGGTVDGGSHLATCRIERRGAGRVRVGEAMPATDELGTGGLPGAGVGRVFQERREVEASSQMRSSDWIGDRWPLERDTPPSV